MALTHTTRVRLRPGFVDQTPGWCADMDKHEGLRTPLPEMKQHMIDVHGFVYEEYERPALTRECPTCHGVGEIDA